MAQMCGATAVKYYLPTIFLALGLGKQLSLLASGIESSLKVGCTIIESLIIDRVGRRGTLLLGSTIMTIALLVSVQHLSFKGVQSLGIAYLKEVYANSCDYSLTELCHKRTQIMSITPRITSVWSSFFSSPLAIR